MEAEGTRFRTGVEIGRTIGWEELAQRYDAVVIAIGSTRPRDLALPGRDLDGIHFAKPYLQQSNEVQAGKAVPGQVTATGKHVIVIGGGDTGSDCVGTALRQGAASVTSLEILPQPPANRSGHQPWPIYPAVYRLSTSHEEGGERLYAVTALEFRGKRRVKALQLAEAARDDAGRFVAVAGTERSIPADLVLIAMGFIGPEADAAAAQLRLGLTARGTIERDGSYATGTPGVFVAGDAGRGQSLIVWAIAEGRSCAAAVDRYLQGRTDLPAAIPADERPLTL
jgi:glutamate synthase (NADPH/NADH) small chain